ncbi:unnamed protein product, partial [Gordionus sp. m RMFG-2023]
MEPEIRNPKSYLNELKEEAIYLQMMIDKNIIDYPSEHCMSILKKEIVKFENVNHLKQFEGKNKKKSQCQEKLDKVCTTYRIKELKFKSDDASTPSIQENSISGNQLSNDAKNNYLDIIRNEKIVIEVRIYFPNKHYPHINFTGPIIGPNGNNIKNLQEVTKTKMAVLGKSSKFAIDHTEFTNSKHENFRNISNNQHVWIQSTGIAANAYLKMALAISEITT